MSQSMEPIRSLDASIHKEISDFTEQELIYDILWLKDPTYSKTFIK